MMCLTVVVTNAVSADGAMQGNHATGQHVRFRIEFGSQKWPRHFSGLPLQTKHVWWRRTDRQTSMHA
jgi:hypothetical protein